MKRTDVNALVLRYAKAAAAHFEASKQGNYKLANRQHDILAAVYRELRARGLPAQQALEPLLDHDDLGVRLWAASHALEFAPDKGVSVLTGLSKLADPPRFEAEMTLREWEKGTLSFP